FSETQVERAAVSGYPFAAPGTPLTVAKPPLPLGTWQVQVDAAVVGRSDVVQTAPPALSILAGPMAVSAHAAPTGTAIDSTAAAAAMAVRAVLRLPFVRVVSAAATQ